MWNHSEVAGLLDRELRVQVISRNEEEAPVRDVIGKRATELINPESVPILLEAVEKVRRGDSVHVVLSATADAGYVYWFRVNLMPSPTPQAPVLFHFRRMPRHWHDLSEREREVVHALHETGMNPKRAARDLGMSLHTLNAHRRSICRKCELRGIGDFWVFVERCR